MKPSVAYCLRCLPGILFAARAWADIRRDPVSLVGGTTLAGVCLALVVLLAGVWWIRRRRKKASLDRRN